MESTTCQPLTARDVTDLATLLDGGRIKIARDPEFPDRIIEGVIRTITRFDGDKRTESADLRDHFVHVSGVAEFWLPVQDVLAAMRSGRAAIRA